MVHRYTPWLTRDTREWAILDWDMNALCTLPGENNGEPLPLRWRTKAAAAAWLQTCYLTWHLWERSGGGKPPEEWRPRRMPSPYGNGLPFPAEDAR